ncbi:MAG TPA: MFS transporter [Steroidobacteraceae bacterium]|nr:MFS transporter [Steroidobacteraceae bacterium]
MRALRLAQVRTLLLLFAGYASCYYCRADLSVATPLIVAELGKRGFDHDQAILRIGAISSYGVLAYAIGKFFLTGIGDYWGGRRSLLVCMAGAVLFTLLFATGSAPGLFALAWVGNRLTQSIGWAGLIKVSSRWFNYSSYGSVLGVLSVSYLIGDALAREQMGTLIEHGHGWRLLFVFAAAVTGLMLLANLVWLRESRSAQGFPEAVPNPRNLFGSAEGPSSFLALLRTLLASRAFLLVCLLSFATTIVRETFNTWTPLYLRDFAGYGAGRAAVLSAVFPGVGAGSVLLAGWWSDRLGVNGRALLLFLGLAATAVVLLAMIALRPGTGDSLLPATLIGLVAFCLLGPYSYLGGAFALDFGGKRASAASSGIIDGIGYLGGVLAGSAVARLAVAFGWPGVFLALAAASGLAALGAGYLYHLNARAAAAAATAAA